MTDLFKLILGVLVSLFKSRARLEAEILVLRQQINVPRRRMPTPMLDNVGGQSRASLDFALAAVARNGYSDARKSGHPGNVG